MSVAEEEQRNLFNDFIGDETEQNNIDNPFATTFRV